MIMIIETFKKYSICCKNNAELLCIYRALINKEYDKYNFDFDDVEIYNDGKILLFKRNNENIVKIEDTNYATFMYIYRDGIKNIIDVVFKRKEGE